MGQRCPRRPPGATRHRRRSLSTPVACATRLRERAWGQLPYNAARRAVTRRRCRVATARNAPPAHAHGATGPRFRHPFPPPRCNCAAALQHLCRTTARRFPRRRSCVATPPGYAHRAMRQRRRSLSTPVAAAALQLRCRVATPVTPAPRHRPRGAGACAESVLTPDGAVAPCIARGRSPAPGDAPHHHYHCPAACWGPILLPAAAAILHHPARGPFRRPAPCVTATLPLRRPAPPHKNCPWRRGEAHRLGEHCQVRCRDRLPVCAPQS